MHHTKRARLARKRDNQAQRVKRLAERTAFAELVADLPGDGIFYDDYDPWSDEGECFGDPCQCDSCCWEFAPMLPPLSAALWELA